MDSIQKFILNRMGYKARLEAEEKNLNQICKDTPK